MSQVKPGGQGSGQRPGPQARKPAPPRRPAQKPGAKRPPTASGGGAKGGPGKGGAGKGGGGRPNKVISAPPPRRFSPSTMAFVAIVVVVLIVLVFVVVKVTGGNSTSSTGTAVQTPFTAPASLVAQVTGVPATVVDSVGLGSGVTAPLHMSGQPPLSSNGKPEVLFIGAEFCPYCAAERWAMVNALGRFGTWSGLKETTSSPWDTDPSTATFSFRDATLTSQYVDFVAVEHETNDINGLGTRKALEPLTNAESALWSKYSSDIGISTGYPFVDMGNKVFVAGPSYDPQILAGLSQSEIAANLANASSAITKAIIGTANYLTAAVCSMTGNQPTAVCSASAVHQAAGALHVS